MNAVICFNKQYNCEVEDEHNDIKSKGIYDKITYYRPSININKINTFEDYNYIIEELKTIKGDIYLVLTKYNFLTFYCYHSINTTTKFPYKLYSSIRINHKHNMFLPI